MKPIYHFALSSLIAGGSFVATRSVPISISTFAVGFLIDSDHLFDYAIYLRRQGSKRLPELKEFLKASYFKSIGKIYVPFHSYELLIPLWLIAFFYQSIPLATWLSISFIGHLLADQLTYSTHPLVYFLTFRIKKRFDYDAICSDKSNDKSVDPRSQRYDERYSFRPFKLRVPGDAMKDRIIYNAIRRWGHHSGRLLDLGCGMGHTTSLLSNLKEVVGVDFSQKAIRIASKKSGGSFVCGDAQALPFQDRSFDYVVSKDVLEHVPNDGQVLDEILRVCKDKAKLLMYLPCTLDGFNLSSESIVKKVTGYTIDPEVGHLRRYSPGEAKQMLRIRGFKILRTWYFVHFSLGVASLLSVKGYKHLSKGKREGDKMVSDVTITLLKFVFKLFEGVGWIEALLFKSFPGAGFFIETEIEKIND